MSHRQLLSTYTPSNTDPELLKRITVQRETLLNRIVARLSHSMTTDDRHHILLIGPRGSGKTHLVTLVEHELRDRDDLDDCMRIAWLGEDDTIAGFIDLALGIAGRLSETYPNEFPSDYREAVRGLGRDDAAVAILKAVIEQLQSANLLLIIENMGRAFDGMADGGQKSWRAFLQQNPRIATLATSQQLFRGIESRNAPFFGFFDIHHLEMLDVDDALDLIRKIATEKADATGDKLVKFLGTAEGRYRVRALHRLAGGNHRMYVLLSEFLTKESLDDLVAAFEQLADELTPYFQERVRSLPSQGARIIEELCSATGAMTVKQVAESTFIPERNCSKQLGLLKKAKYVRSAK